MRPRVGFLGVGWIGRNRMEELLRTGVAEPVAVCDSEPAAATAAAEIAGCDGAASLEEMLELDLDGVVIATPSALHAEQAEAVLEAGAAVFCQKPLGRTEEEARSVVAAARRADLLLAVDLSYRFTEAAQRLREVVVTGGVGRVFQVDLVFHNAYGPDKAWFLDPALAGGGCAIDLGTHLIDLASWVLGDAKAHDVHARLFAKGVPLSDVEQTVEDHCVATFDLDGVTVRLACSWFLNAGVDAVFEATFFGTDRSVSVRNVGGSFYDFETLICDGTAAERLVQPPDPWGGRAIEAWARRLAHDRSFDPAVEDVAATARIIDLIYGRRA